MYGGVKIQDLDHLKERLRLGWAQISQRRVAKAIQAFSKAYSRGDRFEHRLN